MLPLYVYLVLACFGVYLSKTTLQRQVCTWYIFHIVTVVIMSLLLPYIDYGLLLISRTFVSCTLLCIGAYHLKSPKEFAIYLTSTVPVLIGELLTVYLYTAYIDIIFIYVYNYSRYAYDCILNVFSTFDFSDRKQILLALAIAWCYSYILLS